MILVGSQRAGAANLAAHLMNDRDNDHVTLFELRGFIANDLHGSLREIHAISKGTKCDQYMFSLSINPPKETVASEEQFLDAIERVEEKLGFGEQSRAIIFHEKEGRRHAHVVWSRIDVNTMTAINLPHFKTKLMSVSRQLFLDYGWELPDGLRRDGGKSPLNFTLAEWQQAKRLGLDPREIKQSFQEAWKQSDNAASFKHALEEKGYFLAKGDRRGFVAVDVNGEVFSVPRMIGIKTKEVKERLGDPQSQETVHQVRAKIINKVTDKVRDFIDDVDRKHAQDMQPLMDERKALVSHHRKERKQLKKLQKERWQNEERERILKLRKGIKGLWDHLTGRSKTIKNEATKERWSNAKRDALQRDRLVFAQMDDRQVLQSRIASLRKVHAKNRRLLAREISGAIQHEQVDRLPINDPCKSHKRTGPNISIS